ncbi:MAG TPA: hypothetical protein VNL69_11260 [Bacteroidota bacterium]|nr:hypothetical protein [Bacteroidota bacterium]
MIRIRHSIVFVAAAALLLACQQKPPLLEPLPDTVYDTAYVQVTPSFGGFTQPEDLMIGNDQLIYVADTYGEGTGRIVMMNRAGQVLSSRRMLRPISIAQDSRLDLLVGGRMLAPNGDTVAAIFRIHLVPAAHRLENARIDTVWRELARPARRFPGITVFGDNRYLVVRDGPDNTSVVDPDARVLEFDRNDRFISPVASLTTRGGGSGITDIFRPTAIAAFAGSRDFILTQTIEQVAFGALWMVYQSTPEFEGWLPRFDPARTQDRGIDFIRARFVRPEAVTIDQSRRDVFVADAALDSVFKFNSRGTFKTESFGFYKTGGAMLRPTGLAFFERVLYVLDGERGEILRFRLTTDLVR